MTPAVPDPFSDRRRWQWLALAAGLGALVWLLAPILTPFVVSALLAWLGDPLVARIERRGRSRTTGPEAGSSNSSRAASRAGSAKGAAATMSARTAPPCRSPSPRRGGRAPMSWRSCTARSMPRRAACPAAPSG